MQNTLDQIMDDTVRVAKTYLPDGTTITWGTSITNPYAAATLRSFA